jgi:DNA-directed RNA polymerase subunit L
MTDILFNNLEELLRYYSQKDDLIKSFEMPKNNDNVLRLLVDVIEDEYEVTIYRMSDGMWKSRFKNQERVLEAPTLLKATELLLKELTALRDEFLEKVRQFHSIICLCWLTLFPFSVLIPFGK